MGYPIVNHYKYLGCEMDFKLSLSHHMQYISRKFNCISRQLLPIRLQNHLKLNANLFQTLIDPLYFLASTLYSFAPEYDKKAFQKLYRSNSESLLCFLIVRPS